MRSLAAVAERCKIVGVANGPAAGEQRQIGERDSLLDRLVIGEDERWSCIVVLLRSRVVDLARSEGRLLNIDRRSEDTTAVNCLVGGDLSLGTEARVFDLATQIPR